MKKIILAFLLISSYFAQGQDKKITFTTCVHLLENNEAEIIIKGKIADGWHMYSVNPGGDGLAIAPEVTIKPNNKFKLIGKVKESGKLLHVNLLGETWNWYKHEVKYTQKIKYTDLTGKADWSIYYSICDDNACLPPVTENYKADLDRSCDGGSNAAILSGKKVDTAALAKKRLEEELELAKSKSIEDSLLKLKQDSIQNVLANKAREREDSLNKALGIAGDNSNKKVYGEYGTIVDDCGASRDMGLSMWTAFLYGILGGLAALFFPCTLPMIPMTISFFLKGSATRRQGIQNGMLYGFSIFLVYFLLSLPFLFLGWGGNALNSFSTNVWVNLAFFIIFVVFAFSLFGYYDIGLPSWLSSKVDSKSNTKSFVGIFFMALTLAIVSFSCTGPILGLVLGNISNSKLITPAMSGFGIGLGVPFAIFAMFPNLLKALPKSGGWLTVLKVVFGFIELAFALKFLSNADLVKQWGLLKRELFIGIWIVICILTALYLLGILKFKKDPTFKSSKFMKAFAAFCILFAGYLSLDFFGKDTALISGFPPPKFYSYFHKEESLTKGSTKRKHQIKGIEVYLYLEDALAEGIKQNKPVMIDFTGWACVNCRKMEENVWPTSKVNALLSKDYIVASLYVDEQIDLPESEKFMSPYLKRMATTVGDKWFDLSLRNFNAATQPYYVLIDPINHRILNTPTGGYIANVNTYEKFLDCGLKNFKLLHPLVNK